MQNSKIKKIRTAFAVFLLIFTFFSITLSCVEANHQCSGKDCSVCYIINLSEENLVLLKYFSVSGITFAFHFCFQKKNFLSSKNQAINLNTLISKKIRIND